MRHNTLFAIGIITMLLLAFACNSGEQKESEPLDVEKLTKDQPEVHGTEVKPGEVELTKPLNQHWVADGKSIY